MSIYTYSKSSKNMTIFLPVLVMAGLFVWAVYGLLSENRFPLDELILYTMPVLLLSSFIGLHNPSSIKVTDQSITFSGFGRIHTYTWEEAGIIFVRKYEYAGKTFIRLGKPRILGGRYWITHEMNDYKELLSLLEQKSQKDVKRA